MSYKIAFPVFALFLGGFCKVPLKIVLAMLFSVIGDVMGEQGMLVNQIISFAIAHIFLISQFYSMRNKIISPYNMKNIFLLGFLSIIVLVVISSLFIAVDDLIIKVGTILYAIIIEVMVFMAFTQSILLIKVGAVLFMVSDIILAWNIFKEAIPYAQYLIMVPYYLSQLFIFLASFEKNKCCVNK